MRSLSLPNKTSSIALAIALLAGPTPAVAQSFQGSVDSATGATVDQSTPGQTNVSVTGSQAVINWTATNNPDNGVIVFQPDGTTANFFSGTDFAVLNRVTPGTAGNAIYMGGTVNGFAGDFTGGTIFFYSPNGIIIGQNASINVGSLGLTTLPISDDGQGNWMSGFGTADPQVTFGQATDPNSFIRTDAAIDGSINAFGAGSYVALVAPQVTHNGVIRTDTAAALVAAEAATITFSPDGLFDIEVTTGTDAATGIAVGGTIERNSAVEQLGNVHRAYLVAVAKNDAVTMVINGGGSVGFDTATSATVENNAVILSGGYDVQGGLHSSTSGVSEVSATITNATLSSDVDVRVTGGAAINSGDGALSFGGDLTVFSGETTTTGGNALIDGLNGNPLDIAGDLFVRAARLNADGSETGLISRLGAEGGSIVTVGGNVTLDSDSFGADSADNGLDATDAIGGNAQINIGANSSLEVLGSVNVHADGYGGHNFFGGGAAGNGTGGQALVMAISGGATVDIGGTVYVSAQGFGGSAGECSICDVTAGDGTGGNASVHANLGTPNSMTLGSDVTITAAGWGGAGDAQAGTGTGGTANLGASDGSTLTVAADTEVDASGFGGFGFNSADGGLGLGGEARIGTNSGGSIELTGPAFVTADGLGGDGANGGTGTGGVASISAFLGTIHALSNVQVTADSDGGFANSATGSGGDGLADIETDLTPVMTEASLFASGGTLTVDGIADVSANATGGQGGFDGGSGGDAVAAGVAGTIRGGAVVHAANSDDGPSVIELGTVVVTADAEGGQGGDGQGGTNGGNGGNGGSAIGGKAVITAAAGSGDLTAGQTLISASGTGGRGGNGGGGDGGAGGNGGNGGSAEGGFINVGTESGDVDFAQGANPGTATYDSIFALATAIGGDGGNAGFGSPAGIAGNGGDALGGQSTLLVRGSVVNVGTVNLDGSAFGGNGGLDVLGAPSGTGGTAVTGFVGVLVTNRFNLVDQRGTLNAGNISGTAIATGGTGAVMGGQWARDGGASFEIVNSEATVDGVNLAVLADGIDPDSPEFVASAVTVINGTVNVTNDFSMITPGKVSIHVDDNTPLTQALTANSFSVIADNFVHDETRPLPAAVGTIGAGSINLSTQQDLIVDAHLVSAGSLNLFAPGLIDVENAASTGGDLALQAGTTIDGGNQTAAGWVSGNANGNITLGDVDAGDFIVIFSAAGGLSLGSLTAATSIDLEAAGNIDFVDATADDFDFEAGGNVMGGDILAGTSASGEAQGAILLGDISVGIDLTGGPSDDGFAVGIVSATSITVGDVVADEAIGFATFGNLDAGNLDAGTDVMTLIGGDTTIASISAPGRTYHGDAQMFIDAGGPDDFDPSLVLAQAPVPSGGSYAVTGTIQTGQLQVAAASIDTGDISASDSATLDSPGAVQTGNIDAGLLDIVAGTDISTGDIFAFDGVTMDAGGSILAGDIAGGSIDLLAGTDISTGDLTTQIFVLADGFGTLLFPGASITLESGGDISTGTISSIDGVFLNAGGGIATGDIDAIDFVEAHAVADVDTGDIDAGGFILLTADSGGISIGAASAATTFQASAGADLITTSVDATEIDAAAGGTAAIAGAWSADFVQLVSNDINIAANGSIGAAEIDLISSNATQTAVGDGVAGGGYQLSDAEYDRLGSSDIDVIADAARGAAPRILIGDLSVDASGGQGIAEYEFVTFDSESDSVVGSVRVVGEALFTGMGVDDGVAFTTNFFELDAATGLLSLENAPGILGGTLFLDAAHIHVASGDILDQLAEDPQYEGYQDDLNAPAEVQRPDGVVRAASMEIEFVDGGQAELNTLYVQNTGTVETPAGFVVSGAALFGEGNEVTPPPGSIDLIINGQIVTEGGTLTGIDVRDALVESEGDITPFTANSTINGCLLVGACGVIEPPEPPFPPGFNPAGPGIQDEITLIDDGLLPSPEFGNEDFIDDNIETTTEGATSPITPSSPLFDTSALGAKGDVDDPVSGGGNPALMETGGSNRPGDGSEPPVPSPCPADGTQPAGQCKQEKQQ